METDNRSMIAISRASFATRVHIADVPYGLSSWSLVNSENVGVWLSDKDEMLAPTVMQIPFWSVEIVIEKIRSGFVLTC